MNKFFRVFIWIMVLACLGLPLELSAQSDLGINYTMKDGLPSNMVYAIEQDKRGFIWFGTDSGLSRYDGYEFRNYSLQDGLPDVEILKFFKDSQERIWMYTLNGKVGYIQGDSVFTSKNKPELAQLDANSRISGIVEQDSLLFFSATEDGLKIVSGNDFSLVDFDQHPKQVYTSRLCKCRDEVLWFYENVDTTINNYRFRNSKFSLMKIRNDRSITRPSKDLTVKDFMLGVWVIWFVMKQAFSVIPRKPIQTGSRSSTLNQAPSNNLSQSLIVLCGF